MPTALSDIRRVLAQRLRYWGGDISTGLSGTLTANGDINTAIDTTRPEPDDEWNDAYIVFNPGTANALWRRIATNAGYVNSTGTMTLTSPLSSPSTIGTTYELYKVFRPEEWRVAVNWSLVNAYPQRHRQVSFEVPLDPDSRLYDWGQLAEQQQVSNPTVAPTITINAAVPQPGGFLFPAGTYLFAYTWVNDLGESLPSPTTSVILNGNQSISFGALSAPPDTARGAQYYCSIAPNSTKLAMLDRGDGVQSSAAPVGAVAGELWQPTNMIYGISFYSQPELDALQAPVYNTTMLEVADLHSVQRRANPGQYPEVWVDLGSHLWLPIGGTKIQIQFRPWGAFSLRFICTAVPQTLTLETDVTSEPLEMVYAGAEAYLWDLLIRSSTVVAANWKDLLKDTSTKYELLKAKHALDPPRQVIHRPFIQPST